MNNYRKLFRDMPKVELHIHLEGSIPLNALWELIKKYGKQNEVEGISGLEKKFKFTDFPHFIETWIWKNRFINEYDDFTFIAAEVKKDLAAQNIIYSEMFFSPPDFRHKKLEPQRITEAIIKGFNETNVNCKINLVADLVRDFGAEKGMQTLSAINEVKSLGVIGIGIGGSEHAYPPEIFTDVFESARGMGFKTSAHAGEAAGNESVWGAVKSLRADRVGHGTRAVEDPKLVEYLREQKIPIEMCPLSNLRTGVVKSIESHPIKEFFQKGLVVFVNTDDPKMFNNTMDDEFSALTEDLGFTLDEVQQIQMNAVNSAWCSEAEKELLTNEVNSYFLTINN